MLKILGLIVAIRWFYIDVLMLRLDPHDMSIMGGLCGRKINKPIGGIVYRIGFITGLCKHFYVEYYIQYCWWPLNRSNF